MPLILHLGHRLSILRTGSFGRERHWTAHPVPPSMAPHDAVGWHAYASPAHVAPPFPFPRCRPSPWSRMSLISCVLGVDDRAEGCLLALPPLLDRLLDEDRAPEALALP